MNRYIKGILNSCRKRGILATLRFVWDEWRFKRTFKVDTTSEVALGALTLQGNTQNSEHYQAANPSIVRSLLAQIPGDFSNMGFVDIGCGKGRVLILAGLHPWYQLIGIEFGKELVTTAKQNLQKVQPKLMARAVNVLWQDASTWLVPASIHVFFLNNPFHGETLHKVLEQINTSLRKAPREAYLLYVNPTEVTTIKAHGWVPTFTIQHHQKLEAILFTKQSNGQTNK